jgi:hypothetical protein
LQRRGLPQPRGEQGAARVPHLNCQRQAARLCYTPGSCLGLYHTDRRGTRQWAARPSGRRGGWTGISRGVCCLGFRWPGRLRFQRAIPEPLPDFIVPVPELDPLYMPVKGKIRFPAQRCRRGAVSRDRDRNTELGWRPWWDHAYLPPYEACLFTVPRIKRLRELKRSLVDAVVTAVEDKERSVWKVRIIASLE